MNRAKFLDMLSGLSVQYKPSQFYNHERNKKTVGEKLKKLSEKYNKELSDRVILFLTEFNEIEFYRTESVSKDVLHITLRLRSAATDPDSGELIFYIGSAVNSCGTIERFVLSENGSFGAVSDTEKIRYISDSAERFFEYILTKEYDYHITVTEDTYKKLREAGWYEGRRADISSIISAVKANNVELTEAQKEFLREFVGIESPEPFDQHSFYVADGNTYRGMDGFYENPYQNNDAPNNSNTVSQTVTVRVGWCDGFTTELGLSPDGLIVHDSSVIGRTVMEGWQILLN